MSETNNCFFDFRDPMDGASSGTKDLIALPVSSEFLVPASEEQTMIYVELTRCQSGFRVLHVSK
jgi:hypothetical protein